MTVHLFFFPVLIRCPFKQCSVGVIDKTVFIRSGTVNQHFYTLSVIVIKKFQRFMLTTPGICIRSLFIFFVDKELRRQYTTFLSVCKYAFFQFTLLVIIIPVNDN